MLKPGPTLQRRLTNVEQLEIEHTSQVSTKHKRDRERVREFPQLLKPFGFEHEKWEALKAQMQPGDELWECCTDKTSWRQSRGMEWIELVRDGVAIAHLMSRMN